MDNSNTAANPSEAALLCHEASTSAATTSSDVDPNEHEDRHHSSGSGSTHEADDDDDDDEDEVGDDEEMEQQHKAAMDFDPRLGIKEPNQNDILCGRGRSTSDHAANVRFRALVTQNQKAYLMAKRREEKTRITEELVDHLRSTGRFVLFEPKSNLWYEVSPEYAREKVSHSLRSRPERRRIKPAARKKVGKRPAHSPALDDVVDQIIQDQQKILKAMMAKESDRVTAEAIMRATLGH